MAAKVQRIFLLEVQEPGDYLLQVSGVVVLYSNQRFDVYSSSANHNRFRAAVHKFPFSELAQGVLWKGAEYRLTETDVQTDLEGTDNAGTVSTLLGQLYAENPRQLFFLKKYLSVV